MKRVDLESVAEEAAGGVERRRLAQELDATHLAINHYTVEPGDRIAGIHAHADQEEVFVVLDGSAVFETFEGRIPVATGEVLRVPPGEFQSCTNPEGEPVALLALGAPADSEDVRVPVRCSTCGHGEHRLTFPAGEERLVCPDCGAETTPSCSACGGDRLRVVLDDSDRPVDRCRDCGAATPAR